MARTVHVHTGPTLSAADVVAIIPDAVVQPPVAATDLLRLPLRAGDVVVIIDGYYQQAQSVRHKEILLLLERGVEVWGTASMGALRAAELHPFGMRGAGAVFRLYVRGVIEGDDEVGVTHGPAEHGYPVVADALVNIRCTVRRAVREGLVDRDDAAAFVAAAAATPFERRTPPVLVGAASNAGVDAGVARRLGQLLVERRVDVKRRDALRTLHRVRRRLHGAVAPAPRTPVVSDNAHLHLWGERSRVAPDPGDEGPVTDRLVLAACQLYADDYPEFAAPVALRTLAALASPVLAHLRSDEALLASTTVDAPHVGRDQLLRHLRREERLAAALAGRPATPETLAELVLAAATARGVIAPEDAPRWEQRWLRPAERALPDARLRAARRALAIAPGLPACDAFIVALDLAGRFAAAREVARAALAFNEELRATHPEFEVHRIDGARVLDWFAQRWGVPPEELDLELADRGFPDRRDLLAVARPLYMAARFRPALTDLRLCAAAVR